MAVVLSVVLTGGDSAPTQVVTPAPTMAPTPMPTISPSTAQALLSLITDASPDNGQALSDSSTPQSRALAWLEGNVNLDTYTDQQKVQRYVLATLYYSTGGDSWDTGPGWLSDDNECDWYGANECIDGALDGLALDSNDLQGTIPPEISMLSDSLGKSLLQMPCLFPFVLNYLFNRTHSCWHICSFAIDIFYSFTISI